ncbi:SDR family oxidoreductase [Streptomyces massasporeus]|uniref:SDR family oxidoreductase n=1 Tax=Streptomyces massasporeus TaxID=67324 RepID=UPI0038283048
MLAAREGAFAACADASPSMVAEALCELGSLDALGVNVGIGLGVGLAEAIDTRWTARPRPGERRVPPSFTRIRLGRQGTAWEVADAVTCLLSYRASSITGQSLVADGGLNAV